MAHVECDDVSSLELFRYFLELLSLIGRVAKDFLKLVIISIFLASPIAWYVMNNWLKDFAYRVSIEWWVFIFAGIISILIAFFTVSFQSIRAARANPVESLKSE